MKRSINEDFSFFERSYSFLLFAKSGKGSRWDEMLTPWTTKIDFHIFLNFPTHRGFLPLCFLIFQSVLFSTPARAILKWNEQKETYQKILNLHILNMLKRDFKSKNSFFHSFSNQKLCTLVFNDSFLQSLFDFNTK